MPLYEYECDANKHRFEVIQKFSDPPIDTCPTCGSPVHKLLSSPAIQFKGSGWYITDYAKKEPASSAQPSSDTKKDASAPSAGESGTSSGEGKAATSTTAAKTATSATKTD
jgi:putative FmdB family regulatory protein